MAANTDGFGDSASPPSGPQKITQAAKSSDMSSKRWTSPAATNSASPAFASGVLSGIGGFSTYTAAAVASPPKWVFGEHFLPLFSDT